MNNRFFAVVGAIMCCTASGLDAQNTRITASFYVDGAQEHFQHRSHTSIEAMEQGKSVVYSTGGAELILTRLRMNKTSGGVNDPDRRNTGFNSVLLADGGSNVMVEYCTVASHTPQADGISATGDGTKIKVIEGAVTMSRAGCSAVNALNGGYVDMFKTEVNTQSHQSPVFYTYNSGKLDIAEAFGETSGQSSPLFYSSGIINGVKCRLSASGSSIGNVDGGTLTLTSNELKSGGFCGFVLYGIKSKDVKGELNLVKNKISVSEGPVFFVTNTEGVINVKGNSISCREDDLMLVKGDDWGVKGSNGGHISFYAEKQSLSGNIKVDSISSMYLELKKSAKLNGRINAAENRCAEVRVKLDKGSSWTSKGESYLTSIVFTQPVEKGLKQLKGNHTIYYNPDDPENAPLGGKEYKTGGGRLVPLK